MTVSDFPKPQKVFMRHDQSKKVSFSYEEANKKDFGSKSFSYKKLCRFQFYKNVTKVSVTKCVTKVIVPKLPDTANLTDSKITGYRYRKLNGIRKKSYRKR